MKRFVKSVLRMICYLHTLLVYILFMCFHVRVSSDCWPFYAHISWRYCTLRRLGGGKVNLILYSPLFTVGAAQTAGRPVQFRSEAVITWLLIYGQRGSLQSPNEVNWIVYMFIKYPEPAATGSDGGRLSSELSVRVFQISGEFTCNAQYAFDIFVCFASKCRPLIMTRNSGQSQMTG